MWNFLQIEETRWTVLETGKTSKVCQRSEPCYEDFVLVPNLMCFGRKPWQIKLVVTKEKLNLFHFSLGYAFRPSKRTRFTCLMYSRKNTTTLSGHAMKIWHFSDNGIAVTACKPFLEIFKGERYSFRFVQFIVESKRCLATIRLFDLNSSAPTVDVLEKRYCCVF